ncbi:MAG: aminodeoxychorismate synthase component I, partial [Flavobacteriaceae bacterium]
MRTAYRYPIKDEVSFKRQLLLWAQDYGEVAWLDSNSHHDRYSKLEGILAVGAATSIKAEPKRAFIKLREFIDLAEDWVFGYLSYDLKNDLENLSSTRYDGLGFPDLYFFVPKKIIRIEDGFADFLYLPALHKEILTDIEEINSQKEGLISPTHNPIRIRMRMFKETYYDKVRRLLQHIHRGDIYEVNFCQEFYAQETDIDPVGIY